MAQMLGNCIAMVEAMCVCGHNVGGCLQLGGSLLKLLQSEMRGLLGRPATVENEGAPGNSGARGPAKQFSKLTNDFTRHKFLDGLAG